MLSGEKLIRGLRYNIEFAPGLGWCNRAPASSRKARFALLIYYSSTVWLISKIAFQCKRLNGVACRGSHGPGARGLSENGIYILEYILGRSEG